MSFFTQPVGKRTRSQRLLYYQECVKNASKTHGSATTTHMDLVTSSDESLDSHISSKESDGVKHINIKSEKNANKAPGSAMGTDTYFISLSGDSDEDSHISSKESDGVKYINIKSEENANEAPGSAMGTHTYFLSSSDDSDEDEGSSKHGKGSNQFPASDKKAKACSGSVEAKGRSQCQGGGNQSQTIASQNQAGAGQTPAGVGVSRASSVKWTRTRVAQDRGITIV